jgi:homoserine O-acetyltransferase/O-succinyltransferase
MVTGWSMGAGQTYQWAVSYPDMVERIAPFCGSSVTSEHNQAVKFALTTDAAFRNGWYDEKPTLGLRAVGQVYAGLGSVPGVPPAADLQAAGIQLARGLSDRVLGGALPQRSRSQRSAEPLWTWQNGDVGKTPGFDGETERALASIQAKALIMPAEKDLYFPPEDEHWAAQFIPDAEVRVIPGVWGHFAGGGDNPTDVAFIDKGIAELLAR